MVLVRKVSAQKTEADKRIFLDNIIVPFSETYASKVAEITARHHVNRAVMSPISLFSFENLSSSILLVIDGKDFDGIFG
jgi:hypothetical protein